MKTTTTLRSLVSIPIITLGVTGCAQTSAPKERIYDANAPTIGEIYRSHAARIQSQKSGERSQHILKVYVFPQRVSPEVTVPGFSFHLEVPTKSGATH